MHLEEQLTEIFKKSPADWGNADLSVINESFTKNGREQTKIFMDQVVSENGST